LIEGGVNGAAKATVVLALSRLLSSFASLREAQDDNFLVLGTRDLVLVLLGG
jgi:hypothetical protein